MKKVLILLISIVCCLGVSAQTYKFYQTKNYHNQLKLNTKTGEVTQVQDDGFTYTVHHASTPYNDKPNRYALYETKNMWTFILLDKFSGKLWQCQYSVDGVEYIASWVINDKPLSYTDTNKFSITPLTSMYQYYLVNDETGEIWKFQWTTESKEGYRWIEKQ